MTHFRVISAASMSLLLAACGGGGSSTGSGTGSFSFGVSDNPADVDGVTIAFRQVVLKSSDGTYSFDVASGGQPSQVDLLQVTGSATEALVTDQQVPLGEYQLCLYMINDETGSAGTSFVTTSTGVEGLTTNSNGSCGGTGATDPDTGRLFFNQAFTIAAGTNNFVAEFNLEKGLLPPRGANTFWTLKPTAVQLVNVADVGAISGEVSTDLVMDCHTRAGTDHDIALPVDRVYLYPGEAAITPPVSSAVASMVDFRDSAAVSAAEASPIAASRLTPIPASGATTSYSYEIAFVAAGDYSVAYTCTAQNDDPEADDSANSGTESFFLFADRSGITVTSGATSSADLPN